MSKEYSVYLKKDNLIVGTFNKLDKAKEYGREVEED